MLICQPHSNPLPIFYWVIFLLVRSHSSLYILDISSVSDLWLPNIYFFPICDLSFRFSACIPDPGWSLSTHRSPLAQAVPFLQRVGEAAMWVMVSVPPGLHQMLFHLPWIVSSLVLKCHRLQESVPDHTGIFHHVSCSSLQMPVASPGFYLCFWATGSRSVISSTLSSGSINLLEWLTQELKKICLFIQ